MNELVTPKHVIVGLTAIGVFLAFVVLLLLRIIMRLVEQRAAATAFADDAEMIGETVERAADRIERLVAHARTDMLEEALHSLRRGES